MAIGMHQSLPHNLKLGDLDINEDSGPTCDSNDPNRRKMTLPPHMMVNDANLTESSLSDATKRLAASTEGRFTIIDEQSKESESFDEDTDTDTESTRVFSRSFVTTTSTAPLADNFPAQCPTSLPPPNFLPVPARMAAANRFRITRSDTNPAVCLQLKPDKPEKVQAPVAVKPAVGAVAVGPAPPERRYKRGRWTCVEWGPDEKKKNPPIVNNNVSVPASPFITPASNSNSNSNTTTHSDASTKRHLVHEQAFFSFENPLSDESDRENVLPNFTKEPEPMDESADLPSPDPKLLSTQRRARFFAASPDFLSTSGRATPLEVQLHGLERSLSSGHGPGLSLPSVNPMLTGRGSSVPPPERSVGNASSSQIVAIDSKIEQAMDLVKTHLMFAVREEVDILRGKILELETTVYKLEAENSILREHVPNEVLQSLNGAPTNSGGPSQNSTVVAAQ